MAPLSKLLPFILLLVLLGIATFLAYAIYTIVSDVASKTQKKMEEKNVSFSKEGMKVGVREVQNENYVDQTQSQGVELLVLASIQELVLEQGTTAASGTESIFELWFFDVSERAPSLGRILEVAFRWRLGAVYGSIRSQDNRDL
ncbi:MAG: hypothetical protein M1830_010105 [Pleopsidium flavum]|nr:MAG: hypothetical protein M1830_010105 [Pleopsidium flavum]